MYETTIKIKHKQETGKDWWESFLDDIEDCEPIDDIKVSTKKVTK